MACLGPKGTPGMFSISNHECLGCSLTNGAGGMPCSYLCTFGEIETPPHNLPARGEVCFCCVDSPSRTQPVCCALLEKWSKNLGLKPSILWKKGAAQLSPCALLEISVSSYSTCALAPQQPWCSGHIQPTWTEAPEQQDCTPGPAH